MAFNSVMAQRLQQPLGRGVVAVNRSGSTIRSVSSAGGTGNLVSWRKLAQESEGTTYNVYRRTGSSGSWTKITSKPLTKTNYTPSSLMPGWEFAVTAITPDGVEGDMSAPFTYKTQAYPNVWFDFDFDDTVISRDDYRTKFVWPMDTDGDGEYDAVVCDRLYAGATGGDDADEDQADNTATTSHKLQAYKFDGTLLWTVDMGPNVNICGGQNDMVVAYDINCDGRCEVMVRSSDGTRFWDKQNETWGLYANGSSNADTDGDGITDYRTEATRICPFYVSVIDGLTGAEIDCNELKYSEATDGVDQYSRTNRAAYMTFGYSAMEGHFCICYLDGIHPSLVMECLVRETNKTHHNYVFTWDYDWAGGTPSNWHHSATWSRNDKSPWPAEFHQLRVADVNGDGCDEMIQGGYSVNPLTGWFASPGIGHGDRHILSDIDPDRPGLEVYAIQQSALLGQLLYDARTAERIKEWYLPSVYDVGRGACMDVDAARKGYELYSFTDDFIYDCKGDKTGYTRSGCGIKQMFEGVWWNGDLQREELSSPGGKNYGTNLMVTTVLTKKRLVEFSQESTWATHAANGTRPAFMGDIIGDWREEVILAKQNEDTSTGLVGYTTAMPTDYSIYCLQQDPHYRGDCTTRGYYQHPNTGFYLGGEMPLPPLPPVFTADNKGTVTDGKSTMFDLTVSNAAALTLSGSPTILYIMNPRGHDFTFKGTGTTGNGELIKSMLGTATFNCDLSHTGLNLISEGTLAVNGTIAGPVELRARGTLAGNCTLQSTITFEGALNYEGCRLQVSEGAMTFQKSLVLPGEVYVELTPGARLVVNGDLTFQGSNHITFVHDGLTSGRFVIAECTGTLACDPSMLKTRGLEGLNYDLIVDGKQLVLVINKTRDASDGVTWTGAESGVWNYKALNFSTDGDVATPFVSGDTVTFDANGRNTAITIDEMMFTGGVTFTGGTYSFTGEGGISSTGGVTVGEGADVTFDLKNSDYTGATVIRGGQLTVTNMFNGGQASAIGAATTDAGNLVIDGGTLVLAKDNMGTDRRVTLADTATISVAQASGALSFNGQIAGDGYLVKDGPGQLNLNYDGENPYRGTIIRGGILSHGAWRGTFGTDGSPMELAGGELHQLDHNNNSQWPTLNHQFNIVEGTDNKIVGSSRGKINGTFTGKGDLTIESRYVRCEIGADFSRFEGQLTMYNISSDNSDVRLTADVTDMSKTRLVLGEQANMYHKSGSPTMKIGSLSSDYATAVLSGNNTTYRVGLLGDTTTFAGQLKSKAFVKVGTGMLTLTGTGSTAPITVSGGTLMLQSAAPDAITTGLVTVATGATLGGTATTSAVTMLSGSRLLCNLTAASGSLLTVTGNMTHQGDTIVVSVPAERSLTIGDRLHVVSVGGTHSGTFFAKIICEAAGKAFGVDTSLLLSDGILIVTACKGDVNGDGQVGIADIVAVTNVMAGSTTTGEDVQRRADVNGDGQVGIADIVAITNIMAGK